MYSKSFAILLILMLFTINISVCSAVFPLDQIDISNDNAKKWTFMVYSCADAPDTGYARDAFAKYTASNEYIDVVILEDSENDSAKIWYVEYNHNLTVLEDLGEISMGDYTTLRDFIAFCKNDYPSQRYILFFYGHGAGWAGALRDHGSGVRDDLTMDEMQKAFNESGGVDIICFSAPCLMSAIESAYELRNYTEIYIGSEAPSWFGPWCGLPLSKTFNLLNQQNNYSNSYIGCKIIQYIKENIENLSFFDKAFFTVSAIKTSELENLTESINQLAQLLIDEIGTNYLKIRLVRSITRSFSTDLPRYGNKIRMDLIDIYDFSKKCSKLFFFNTQIRSSALEVMENLQSAVIANFNGKFQLNSNGISIYFPRFKTQYRENYESLNLDFVNDTCWDEFLKSYLY
jgi:hypothetical protein